MAAAIMSFEEIVDRVVFRMDDARELSTTGGKELFGSQARFDDGHLWTA